MNIFILGSNGMAGSAIFVYFKKKTKYKVYGSIRGKSSEENIFCNIDAFDFLKIEEIIKNKKIDCVINCIGLIKQKNESNIDLIKINSIFPHKLASICEKYKTRLIQLSTDCVFDGSKGNYKEEDEITAKDIYGQTKYCGELSYPNTFTIRTSIIGKEISTKNSLVEWFLNQTQPVKGFKNAIYTGFPTTILAEIIDEFIIHTNLHGVYHVSSDPISKYDLLVLISKFFNKNITIHPDEEFFCDRSLNCDRFKDKTGFLSKDWEFMIKKMYENWNN